MNHLSDEIKKSLAVTPAAGVAGSSSITGATLDTQGFNALEIVVAFGAIVSGAATSIKLQCGAASDASDMADVAGTSQTVADTDDNTVKIIDVQQLPGRYARVIVSRATQNATVGAAIYNLYQAKALPVTQHADVTGHEKWVAPQYGTA